MKSYLTSRHGVVAGSVLALLFMSGAAVAITETAYNYSTPKNGYYGIASLAVAPTAGGGETYQNGSSGLTTTGSFQCFGSAVNLPNGAIIKTLTVYYRGTDEGDVSVGFTRELLSSGAVEFIASKSFNDTSTNRKAQTAPITAAKATVNNTQYNYGFTVCVDPGGTFHGARIAYTYTSAGD